MVLKSNTMTNVEKAEKTHKMVRDSEGRGYLAPINSKKEVKKEEIKENKEE